MTWCAASAESALVLRWIETHLSSQTLNPQRFFLGCGGWKKKGFGLKGGS